MGALQYRSIWKPLDKLELPLLKWVERVRAGGVIERATRVITESGQHGAVWFAIAGVAASRDEQRRDRWIGAGVKVAGVYAATTALKLIARRQRPPIAALGTPTALSFPSSHATTSFAAARLFSEIAPGARPLFYFAAVNVTGSRLHFCVHYPSDLIAGAVLGDLAARAISPNR
ncbi:MAG: phosphatase PAP2 family protein [Thermoleophilaceae bacterium]|nr:phosphatase PAP2 family protein [Thermoleophilaceae bacterium]